MRLYGTTEIATEMGVAISTITKASKEGRFPAPDWRLKCGPIWREETIREAIAGGRSGLQRGSEK